MTNMLLLKIEDVQVGTVGTHIEICTTDRIIINLSPGAAYELMLDLNEVWRKGDSEFRLKALAEKNSYENKNPG